MYEETEIKYVIVSKFKTQLERDNFELSMQWSQDIEKFKKLIQTTNITELAFYE